MARKIVFVGNFQMQALKTLYDRFVVGYTRDETMFLPSYREIDGGDSHALIGVTLIVEQIQELAQTATLPEHLGSAERCAVPLVSADFLWPFAGEQHPRNDNHPYLKGGPYPGELGDKFLNRLIHDGVSAEDAVGQYRAHSFSDKALDRRYELSIDRQRRRDEICGFSIANEIERFYRTEPLFLSPHHPGLRISRALAEQCFSRIGAPRLCIDLLSNSMRRSPFPLDELPVHPVVAAHFKLSYVNSNTTYPFRGEGRFSWEQWAQRYMRYSWEPNLFEAVAISEINPTKARELFDDVLQRLPDTPLGRAALARALSRLGDPDGAAKEIEKAITLDPQDPAAWRLGALIALQRGVPDVARQFAVTAVDYDPADISNLNLLAKIQEDLKDFPSAEWTRRKVIFLTPYDAACRTELGTTLMHQDGRGLEALAEYHRAIAIDGENAGAYFGASSVLAQLGRNEEGIEAVQRAIAIAPEGPPLYHSHLGHLLGRIGRRGDAIAAFARVLESEPNNAGVHNVISDLLRQEGQTAQALRHIRRASEIEPETARFLITLSQMLTDAKRLAEAIVPMRQVLALQPDSADLHLRLGLLYARDDRLKEAATELDEALRLKPQSTEALHELSRVFERMGNLDGAEIAIDRALALQPEQTLLLSQKQSLQDLKDGKRFQRVSARNMALSLDVIVPAMQFLTPKCLLYTNFMKLNPEFGGHHLTHLYIERERYLPDISTFSLDSAVELAVPTGEDFIPFCGDQVVADQVMPHWTDQDLQKARAACTRRDEIHGPAVLIGRYGIRTWGHWLGELLPKLVAVEALRPNHFRYILPNRFVSDPHHRTALESLRSYGIGLERVILVAERTSYAASDLHVVTSVWSPDHMINPAVAELMRTQAAVSPELCPGPERVALLRRGAQTRNVANIAEVQTLLEHRGFTVLDIETMNFEQQVNLFRSAKFIVSVLGSGLTGLIYSPLGVKILTLAPNNWGDLFFFALMQERNAKLADVRGSSLATESGKVATASFWVDPAEIEVGLAALDEAEGEAVVRAPAILAG